MWGIISAWPRPPAALEKGQARDGAEEWAEVADKARAADEVADEARAVFSVKGKTELPEI